MLYRVRYGADLTPTNTNAVLVVCPYHGLSLYCDGRVDTNNYFAKKK